MLVTLTPTTLSKFEFGIVIHGKTFKGTNTKRKSDCNPKMIRIKPQNGRTIEITPPSDVKAYKFREFLNEFLTTYREGDEITAKGCVDKCIGGVRDEETAAKYLHYITEKYSRVLHLKGPFRSKPGNIYKIGCNFQKAFQMQLEALESQVAYCPGDIVLSLFESLRPESPPKPAVPHPVHSLFEYLRTNLGLPAPWAKEARRNDVIRFRYMNQNLGVPVEEDVSTRAKRLLRWMENRNHTGDIGS